MGIKKLYEDLAEKKIYIRSCNNDKIRAARAVLRQIGWITQLDSFYDFNLSQKWGIGENCPRYGDFITFVGMDVVRKVVKEAKEKVSLKIS